jgi:phosphatidylethanolamine-binding protein (PEBP) family uncharacterized protein
VPSTSIEVSIPGLLPNHFIPKLYTCDGADVSLPVQWGKIPDGTAELDVFVINQQPHHAKATFDWAVAGLSPILHGISAGRLPHGAIVGRNSFGNVGYTICPPEGTVEEQFIVRVVALPTPIPAKLGFAAEAMNREAERSAKVVGIGSGQYTRP